MNMPKQYPLIRVPMYVVTIVQPTGALLESGYKTRAELVAKLNEVYSFLHLVPQLDGEDYITQSIPMTNGNTFIITTIYIQIGVGNE